MKKQEIHCEIAFSVLLFQEKLISIEALVLQELGLGLGSVTRHDQWSFCDEGKEAAQILGSKRRE